MALDIILDTWVSSQEIGKEVRTVMLPKVGGNIHSGVLRSVVDLNIFKRS